MTQQVTANNTYGVVTTDSGKWLHAPGTDFVFAFLDNSMDEKVKNDVTKAFEDAMAMSSKIKKAVKDVSGKDALNGLYVLDQASTIKAMNSIDGMAETSAADKNEKGEGTAVEINQEFFGAVLAGVSGNVAPLTAYLTKSMGDVQAEVKKTKFSGDFGTVIGFVSLMPVLNVPVTTFKYAYSSEKNKKWFIELNCGSVTRHSYDYTYTAVDFNYVHPAKQAHK